MKKITKKLAAGLLAVSVATTGLAVNFSTAEAGLLGGLGDVVGGGKSGGSSVDVSGLNKSQTLLLANLAVSAGLMQTAFSNAENAKLETIENAELITTDVARKSFATNDLGVATKMKEAANKADKEKTADSIKQNLAAAMQSGDEAKLKQIDKFIKSANEQRMLSDTLSVVAGVQAAKIIADTAKGGLSLSNAGNIVKFAKTAQQAQSLLKVRSTFSKSLSAATAEYKKNRGLKDPSKAEIDKQAKTMEANE